MDTPVATSKIADSAFKQAQLAHSKGQLADAQNGYQAVLAAAPEHADAWHMLGVLQGQTGNPKLAIDYVNKSLALQPRNPKAMYNLGRLFQDLGDHKQAILALTRAVRLDSTYARAWNNLAISFLDQQNYDAALSAIESGISADPSYEPLHDNACLVHKRRSAFDRCLESADVGLQFLPKSSVLWIHRADACFALARFEEAWDAYEWRFRSPHNPNKPPDYPIQKWQGEDLADRSILIWTEQGPGETFLFSSMLNEILSRAKTCTILTTARLLPILTRSFPNAHVLDGEHVTVTSETADFQSSLISLGRWLRTSWSDFPRNPPHIKPDPHRIRQLSDGTSGDNDPRPAVGIAWRSFGVATADQKSIPLDALRPILAVPGIRFVSLQYGDVTHELKAMAAATGIEIQNEHLIDPVTDMEGHVAQIATLDLVISSSNSTVHAAAAQGVPVWCSLPHTLGEGLRWPWFVDRADSPWYPTLKLYRQRTRGDWSLPIAEMAVDLAIWREERPGSKIDGFSLDQHLLALASAFHKTGQHSASVLASEAAIERNGDLTLAYRIAALGQIKLQNYADATQLLDQALQKNSDNVDLLIDRAAALLPQDRLDEAETDLLHALSVNPECFEALNNLGRLKTRIGDSPQALEYFSKAIAKMPNNTLIKLAIGSRLTELGRLNESRSIFEKLIEENNSASEAAVYLGMALLLNGSLSEGWKYLRYRLTQPTANVRYDHFPVPAWSGESVKGRNVLAWTEQGIGEEILVATMIKDLSRQAKAVTLLCSSRLVPLLKRSLPGVRIAVREDPLPAEAVNSDIDVQMSMSDLGQLLRPTLENFPMSPDKPTLMANPQVRKRLRNSYTRSRQNKYLVGLSWHSSTPEFGRVKSLSPERLAEPLRRLQATFVSLQYSPSSEHSETFQTILAERWINDQTIDPLVDMDQAAAQVAAMDFVITISNTTAHVAGALGIPTALLVPRYSGQHWYWFKNQEYSPWYPTVKIYPADESLAWDYAISSIVDDLTLRIGDL